MFSALRATSFLNTVSKYAKAVPLYQEATSNRTNSILARPLWHITDVNIFKSFRQANITRPEKGLYGCGISSGIVLSLLRLNEETRQELIDRLSDMYIGYWKVNNELIDIHLSRLANERLIKYLDKYEITKKGSDALSEND